MVLHNCSPNYIVAKELSTCLSAQDPEFKPQYHQNTYIHINIHPHIHTYKEIRERNGDGR
jgi:hypothetical protein